MESKASETSCSQANPWAKNHSAVDPHAAKAFLLSPHSSKGQQLDEHQLEKAENESESETL